MKTSTSALALILALAVGSAAAAQSANPDAKGNAPLKDRHTVNDGTSKSGANSFTEGEARQHILNSGYSDVTGLTKGQDGVWRGTASKGGAPRAVELDFKGNVTDPAAGASATASATGDTARPAASMPAQRGAAQ